MPVYKGKKPGTLRVVVWVRGKPMERVVRSLDVAEKVEAALRQEGASNDPRNVRVAKIGNGAQRVALESPKSGPVVYFVSPGRGLIKIGRTVDLDARLETLQCGSPERLVLLGTVPGGAAVERLFHVAFARCRVGGEWFEMDDEMRAVMSEMFLTPEEQAAERRAG